MAAPVRKVDRRVHHRGLVYLLAEERLIGTHPQHRENGRRQFLQLLRTDFLEHMIAQPAMTHGAISELRHESPSAIRGVLPAYRLVERLVQMDAPFEDAQNNIDGGIANQVNRHQASSSKRSPTATLFPRRKSPQAMARFPGACSSSNSIVPLPVA